MKKNFIFFLSIFLIISQIFTLTVYANEGLNQPNDVKKAENPAMIHQVIDVADSSAHIESLLKEESEMLIEKKEYDYKELYAFISKHLGDADALGANSIAMLPTDSYNDASRFVPDSATINELSVINDSIVLGYVKNSKRYIIELFKDGSIRKTISKKVNDTITVYTNFNNSNLKKTESNEILTKHSSADNKSTADTVQVLVTKTVDPKPVSSSYPPYNARRVYQTNYNFPSLTSLGYPTTQPVKVYETMDYYSEANQTNQFFAMATNVVSIASFFEVAVGTATGWLAVSGVVLDIYNRLTEACNVINEHSYQFAGGKEGTVYDPTSCSSDVEVYSEWGDGLLTLVWQYNSSTGFKDPTWGISARPSPFLISNSSFADTTAQTYNNNIYTYGIWKWGVGRLGY